MKPAPQPAGVFILENLHRVWFNMVVQPPTQEDQMRLLGIIAVISAAILATAAVFYWNTQQRENQRHDFRDDLVHALNYDLKKVGWDDETTSSRGRTKTESVLEAQVVVAGCQLELERKKGEDSTVRLGTRDVELFVLDEGIDANGEEFDFEPVLRWPTPDDLSRLVHSDPRLNYCAT